MKWGYTLLLVWGVSACNAVSTISVSSTISPINNSYSEANKIDSIVAPYRAELSAEMEAVIAYASYDFEKGRPNGVLNNWAADAVLTAFESEKNSHVPLMALLNVGGLRNPISEGDVTLGDLYKLMPFDNEVVIVELPWSTKKKLEAYLISRDGEPIGGAKLINGELVFNDTDSIPYEQPAVFRVITSDYLMNGGDNMVFFQDRTSEEYTGKLLRDVFIEQVKQQGELIWNNEKRIILTDE